VTKVGTDETNDRWIFPNGSVPGQLDRVVPRLDGEMIDEMGHVFEAELNLAQKHRLNDSGRGKDAWG
jgi:hypothetical protein